MALFATLRSLKTELDALRPLSAEQEQRVLQKFRLDWNYNSNAIEGNSLTLGETRSLLLHGLTAAGKPMRDHLDIKGHNEAVLWLEDFVRDERPLTEQFIRGMHQVLLGEPYEVQAQTPDGQPTRKMIQPGQYKRQPNNVLTSTGEMFYFASPEETPGRMTDLVDWYRQETENSELHPVALAAEFHYRFVRIHPFDDGNGRMSRLLMNLILLRHGYSITVIKAADRNRYLATLAEADAGEPEPFLRFIIENVEASLRLMIRAAKGESIDEPDDLDKKLALLKKQVLSREDKINVVWSPEIQEDFYHALLEPWFNNVALEVERYDELFLGKSISITYHKVGEKTFSGTKASTLIEAQKDAQTHFSKLDTPLDHYILVFNWTTFRISNNPFDLRLLIDFKFAKYEFEVYFRLFESKINLEEPTSIL
ncbi:Fic family protein [Hymenobacter sp. PAMC 26628]|uniref:Fic family protein n=1 Tax=Hymenobacter sp. PAMC 26628 TaxID=1484118 RepID=UPI00076FED14|nr:Fic family protein [Hymenobacter sp. PAMC 26628]AMJ66805.1 hypothetical protein AXW84_16265 [Hymenobacter sp. PAMC 26628]